MKIKVHMLYSFKLCHIFHSMIQKGAGRRKSYSQQTVQYGKEQNVLQSCLKTCTVCLKKPGLQWPVLSKKLSSNAKTIHRMLDSRLIKPEHVSMRAVCCVLLNAADGEWDSAPPWACAAGEQNCISAAASSTKHRKRVNPLHLTGVSCTADNKKNHRASKESSVSVLASSITEKSLSLLCCCCSANRLLPLGTLCLRAWRLGWTAD